MVLLQAKVDKEVLVVLELVQEVAKVQLQEIIQALMDKEQVLVVVQLMLATVKPLELALVLDQVQAQPQEITQVQADKVLEQAAAQQMQVMVKLQAQVQALEREQVQPQVAIHQHLAKEQVQDQGQLHLVIPQDHHHLATPQEVERIRLNHKRALRDAWMDM